jgi:hypothetical protein
MNFFKKAKSVKFSMNLAQFLAVVKVLASTIAGIGVLVGVL